MTNPNVNKVERDQIECALVMLEGVDADAANLLRSRIRAFCLFDMDLLEMRELMLRVEARCSRLGGEAHELAIAFERVARDAEL